MADHDIEAALVSGAMPVDAHSILLSTGYQNRHADMDVGVASELTLGQKTVTVTIATHIEYEKMQSSIIFGSLQALSWLIFLFGVVNLINTTLSNQMSRKRENSILRSVGLTGKQLCRMSITEGMCYALFAALAVVILGVPISMAVCVEVSKKSFAGAVVPYQFPFLQMGLFLLVLFGMEVVLSVWMVRRQKKQSLVEQIRAQS